MPDYRDFAVGNVLTDGVLSQEGNPKYSCTVRITGGDYSDTDHVLVGGVITSLDIEENMGIVVIITPVAGSKLISLKTGADFGEDVSIGDGLTPIENNLYYGQYNPLSMDSRQFLVVAEGGEITPPIDPEPPTEPPTGSPTGSPDTILNNYLLTKDELYDLQNQVYGVVAATNTTGVNFVDFSSYISAVYVYPFKIPESNILGREKVRIKSNEFTVSTRLNSDFITVDLGSITIPRNENNPFDYLNVEADLFLPFTESKISLDVTQVVGRTINIQYIINTNNGRTTVNILDAISGKPIAISVISIGSVYPFTNFTQIKQIDFAPSEVRNNITRAFVTVKRPDYSGNDKIIKVKGGISDVKGFVNVQNPIMLNAATRYENELIRSILSSGVYIK